MEKKKYPIFLEPELAVKIGYKEAIVLAGIQIATIVEMTEHKDMHDYLQLDNAQLLDRYLANSMSVSTLKRKQKSLEDWGLIEINKSTKPYQIWVKTRKVLKIIPDFLAEIVTVISDVEQEK